MIVPTVEPRTQDANPLLELNREALKQADVFCVSLVGGPGCGKTRLINATIDRLQEQFRIGVIACDISSKRDAERISFHTGSVVQVEVGKRGLADPADIYRALQQIDLKCLDLLLIENVGSLDVSAPPQLGQNATVTIFSVAGGDDKAEKHAELVRDADAILLNKMDLLSAVPFNLRQFRDDVRRIKPGATLFEMSAIRGEGFEP